MKKIKEISKKLIQDESAQGATEYILLLVVVVALSLAFKDKIMTVVQAKLGDLGEMISSFK